VRHFLHPRPHPTRAKLDHVGEKSGHDRSKDHGRKDSRPRAVPREPGNRQTEQSGPQEPGKIPVKGQRASHAAQESTIAAAHGFEHGLVPRKQACDEQSGCGEKQQDEGRP